MSTANALPRPSRSFTPGAAALTLLIIAIAVASAFPLAWMLLTSLKTPQETMQVPPVWLPASPSLDAYAQVAGVISLGRSIVNSALIATLTTAAIIVTASPSASPGARSKEMVAAGNCS